MKSVLYRRLELVFPTHTPAELAGVEGHIVKQGWVRGLRDGSLEILHADAPAKLKASLLKPLSPALEDAARKFAAEGTDDHDRTAARFVFRNSENPEMMSEDDEDPAATPRVVFGNVGTVLPDPDLVHMAKQPLTDSAGGFRSDVAAARAALTLAKMPGAYSHDD